MTIELSGDLIAPGYNLTDKAMQELTARLLEERPPTSTERFICYRLDGNDPLSDIGRNTERVVFEEAFKGNDAKKMTAEYGPYDAASTFFVTIDTERQLPTGMLRVISHSDQGFKSANDLEKLGIVTSREDIFAYYGIEDKERVWDIGTVGVMPELRSRAGVISVQLYRAMYLACLEAGIEHYISIVDTERLEKLRDFYGIAFEDLMGTEPFPYLDSPSSQAVYGYVPELFKAMSETRDTPESGVREALEPLAEGSKDETIVL